LREKKEEKGEGPKKGKKLKATKADKKTSDEKTLQD